MIDNPVTTGLRKTLTTTGMGFDLPPQVRADLEKIKKKLKGSGIMNEKGKYGTNYRIINANDAEIIKFYNSLAHGILSYYRCADNLGTIKSLISHTIKSSLRATLITKHKLNKANFDKKFGDSIACKDNKGIKVNFLTNSQIQNLKKEFLKNTKTNPLSNINKTMIKLTNSLINSKTCAVQDCTNQDIEIHHIRQLHKRTSPGETFTVITAGKSKKVSGLLAIQSALKRKQIPLCKEHHKA